MSRFLSLTILSLCVSLLHSEQIATFDKILEKVHGLRMKTVAVAGAAGDEVLKSVREAKDRKIADAVLFGDEEKMRKIASEINVDISDFKIVDSKDEIETARLAVQYVHEGKAEMYMKGTINTKDVLRAVLDREIGLRTGRPLSMVAVFEIEGMSRLLFVTDAAVMPYPTFDDKIRLIENTLEVANAIGIMTPKVAVLTAIEVVNPKMPETVEAAQLTEMNGRGEIPGCIIDGPLSMDLALDPKASVLKRQTHRRIVGDADILLFPNIHGANFIYKLLTHVVNSKNGNVIAGTSSPFILTSRSDTHEVKLNSILLASIYAEYLSNLKKNN